MKRFRRIAGIILAITVIITTSYKGNVWAAVSPADIEVIIFNEDYKTTIKGFMKDDCPVPYVDMVAYLNLVYTIGFQAEPQGNGIYKIINNKGWIFVDSENDTIYSEAMEAFLYNNELTDPDNNNAPVYERFERSEYVEAPNFVNIDLKNYHIDIISEGDRVYLPLTTIADLVGASYNNVSFKNNKIFINNLNNIKFFDWTSNYEAEHRDAIEISYTYNELCFLMDNLYGCPPNCILSDSIKNNGFDTTLDSFSDDTRKVKECLQSDKMEDYLCGWVILSYMMYDGGHTNLFTFHNFIVDTETYSKFLDIVNDESDERSGIFKKYYGAFIEDLNKRNAIKNYEEGFEKYNKLLNEYDCLYCEEGDTGIFVYHQYNEDVVRTFKKALDIAKDHGMKNFLLDQAINSGGSSESLMYMLNAISGGNFKGIYAKGVFSDSLMKDIFEFDMDQDGVLEGDNEEFDYPFNYGVMCSASSFSSGNLMACYAKEMGIPIIGETSGGGTCNAGIFALPLGCPYNASAFRTYVTSDGNHLEEGAKPDYDITKVAADGSVDYSDFFNLELLCSIMDKHFHTGDGMGVGSSGIYHVTKAPGGVSSPAWTRGSGDFTFTIEGDATHDSFERFDRLKVDEKVLEENVDFSKKKGSLILTIKGSALSGLSTGEHKITVGFKDGQETSFKMKVRSASYDNDDDGDSGSTSTYFSGGGSGKRAPNTGEI